ncbi:augmin subunit 6 [Tanacetum coccineum]
MTMEQETELESALYTNCLLLGLDPSIIGSNRVVQKIISELESQGALPKSHSRLSSLFKCYGPRFVELLWQLSLHALREVHRRTYAADVVLNPLPASLTDVASHMQLTTSSCYKREEDFFKNAEIGSAVNSYVVKLAHEMTGRLSSLGGLRVQAYLQQELEKLHDLRNKVKMEGEQWDELVSSSSQNSLWFQEYSLWVFLYLVKVNMKSLPSGH